MKADIYLRREELKKQIDEEVVELIKKLDEYEAECKSKIASMKTEIENNEKLNEWKDDLNRWYEQMNTFKKDLTLWKTVCVEVSSKYAQVESAYDDLYDTIFLNRLTWIKFYKSLIGSDRDLIR